MYTGNLFQPPTPKATGEIAIWQGLYGASVSLALSNVMQAANRPVLIIAKDSLQAAQLAEELDFFCPKTYRIQSFPDWETLPYDHFSPHQDIISDRLSVLHQLPYLQSGAVLTTIANLMHRLPPQEYLEGHHFSLKIGEQINLDIFRTRMGKAGYHAVSQVREHGEFAIRGSIIDLYPMGSHTPFRIDLFDNEIESIRLFSTETQRSLEQVDAIELLPAKEFPLNDEAIERFRQQWRSQFSGNPLKCPIYQDITEGISSPGIEYYLTLFFEKTAALFDYLPKNTLIITVDDIQTKANEFWQEIAARYEQSRHDITRPLIPPHQAFIPVDQVNQALHQYSDIQIVNDNKKNGFVFATSAPPALDVNHKASQPLAPLKQFIDEYDGRILFSAESLGRREVLLQLFNTIQLRPTFFSTWHEFLASNDRLGITVSSLEEGFQLNDPALTIIPEAQLYGKRVMQRRLRKKTQLDPEMLIRDLTELQINDAVVHIDHGVGRYLGLQTLKVGDQVGEFLTLAYQGDDKLYVPVSSLHLISRYAGTNQDHVPINKLGTDLWSRAKRRAAEKIRDVAAELLDLYAKRAAKPGHIYELPHEQYAAFSAAFPFEETPDQLQAIDQVFTDMTSDKSMDRVICGDVGFGKTEVALRAAFLAVQNSKQVILLVPTTLLAQQHFENFRTRFADWPIQVEMLSRFRTAKESKLILKRMEEGTVDIVIGTHKLLQDDIKFKSLGLVIIDEEHRFGVKQKEKLKVLRASVDMLTLTATPIPRTLNMALSGIRDLSVIATPPLRRLSVKTFVHEYQDSIIQEAIQREIMRGGQVFFLHNDVSTINQKAEEIKKLVHEARPIVAHGQMHERELERVMAEFYHRHANILVCSTIIENGIDIPTANTIIINRADKFGLAQLHQLRGRVGRSHHQAYAYMLTPPKKGMTTDAIKRLEAISSLDDLGIGFTLATHDLEIRGAGELLGESQSGDMQEIGFTLYMDLLSRAVDSLKSGKEPDLELSLIQHRSEIDLHISALIPEDYLNDVQLRLQFYKRIANAKNEAELDEIQVEMIDRFGLLPEQIKNLIAVTELKQRADSLGITKIEAGDKSGRFEFSDKPNIKPETIIRLIQIKPLRYRLDGPSRLRFSLDQHEINQRVNIIKQYLNEVAQ